MERPTVARRLGIGTVQFGQAYGISNRRGQVPLEEVRAILSRAAQAGVGLLDTAANYGEAEEVLSQMDTGAFRIVTKTISVAHGVEAVVARARQSVKNLGRVDLLLVHAASDLLGPQGDAVVAGAAAAEGGRALSAASASPPMSRKIRSGWRNVSVPMPCRCRSACWTSGCCATAPWRG